MHHITVDVKIAMFATNDTYVVFRIIRRLSMRCLLYLIVNQHACFGKNIKSKSVCCGVVVVGNGGGCLDIFFVMRAT